MRVSILAVGRMKAGPERELAARYLDRFAKAGPALGLDYRGLSELPEGRAAALDARRQDEAERIGAATAEGAVTILLDETGRNIGSEAFAALLAAERDAGSRDLVFAIGGPDGFDPAYRAAARHRVAFGAMTWPHQLVRIMLAEQLYRASTILSGHPYHRA